MQLEADGDAANGDEATLQNNSETKLRVREHCITRTWLLSSQHTAEAEQLPPVPTPMTVIGEQLIPRRTLAS